MWTVIKTALFIFYIFFFRYEKRQHLFIKHEKLGENVQDRVQHLACTHANLHHPIYTRPWTHAVHFNCLLHQKKGACWKGGSRKVSTHREGRSLAWASTGALSHHFLWVPQEGGGEGGQSLLHKLVLGFWGPVNCTGSPQDDDFTQISIVD